MNLIPKAQEYAKKWHVMSDGSPQMYGGETYYEGHLERVASLVEAMGGDSQTIAVAYLHDILEDTLCPPVEILTVFGGRIYDAVVALTKIEDVDYKWYMLMLQNNRTAIIVKFADSSVNFATSVMDEDPDRWRRIKKYAHNIRVLEPLL